MGRSQLKYRPTRGRGQGDSARGGRGGGAQKEGGGRGGGGRGRRSGGRPLESNAFRYEERNEEDGEESANTDVAAGHNTSRQFFAEERQYRDMVDVKESYFRTKAMQEWDADDGEGEEATGTVGIMDFAWIAEHLSKVPLSARFQIDPKFRVDDPSEDPTEEESENELTPQPTTSIERAADVASQSKPVAAQGSELDELLALSSAAAATTSSVQTAPPTSALSAADTLQSPATGSGEQENLEDWLDDVLDM